MPKFIKSAIDEDSWIKDELLEVCLVGRSNVGKSSLVNTLAKANIAHTSKTPGRTQTINFYDFNHFRVVDLPGYGYAQSSRQTQTQIHQIIDKYLANRGNLCAVFQICDANVITAQDTQMSKYLQKYFKNHYVILNKIDKQNINTYKNKLVQISKYLSVNINNILLVSTMKKTGIDQVWSLLHKLFPNP